MNYGAGKGDKPRPISIDKEQYLTNWERTFGNKDKPTKLKGNPNKENK